MNIGRLLTYLLILIGGSILLISNLTPARASTDADSLLSAFERNPSDTVTGRALDELISSNLYNDPALAILQANRVLTVAETSSNYDMSARMRMNTGIAYDMMGLYDSALVWYQDALQMAEKYHFNTTMGDVYNNLSIMHSVMGQMEKSLEYCLMAMKIFEDSADSGRIAKVYNNLGSRYSEMGINDKALEFYQRAVDINTLLGDLNRLARNYGNIGTIYSSLEENEKALEYYRKAHEIQEGLDNKTDLSISLSNMAISFQRLGKYDSAIDYANQSHQIVVETGNEIGELTYLTTIAGIYQSMGQHTVSLQNYRQAEELAVSIGAQQNLLGIYSETAEVYASMNDFKKAFEYNEKYNDLRLSLLDLEKDKALAKLKEYEEEKKQDEINILTKDAEIQKLNIKRQKLIRNSVALMGVLLLALAIGLWQRYRYVRKTRNELAEKNVMIQKEKDKSDELLLNILPAETAEELKTKGRSEARQFEMVTVLFTDFKGFTQKAEQLTAAELVNEIDLCFKAFDQIISRHHIEKIKTIGDAYMCAGGLPVPNTTNPIDTVRAALEIRDFMDSLKEKRMKENRPYFEIRIGVHTGPVIAGIVGVKKFAYDIWGDTVNIASRMESSGEVGMVNISGITYEVVKEHFMCTHRGKIEAKNKGAVDMYFVEKEARNLLGDMTVFSESSKE
jgi:class 3 adenylate cyclase/Tfp pilus assembly protein PilF